jgi:hypothetical protein
MGDARDVVCAVNVRTDLDHGEVPVVLHALCDVYEGEGDHPVVDGGRVGVKGEYLELDRVEAVDGDGCL